MTQVHHAVGGRGSVAGVGDVRRGGGERRRRMPQVPLVRALGAWGVEGLERAGDLRGQPSHPSNDGD
ncbi:hypothetical protein, partial [Microbacterium sp. Marseille-Q6648]|uniref:hypothetical protein n=1 Tax=Microbacterium sp. Marseille-Q6648 TaxID=2937991 RepID=UPI00203B3927